MNIDATNHVLGRLSTHVVQRLKDGDEVNIVNAEKAIVKGRPDEIIERYQDKYERGSRDHGPYYPKEPERILRRTIKGMLPDNKEGKQMLGRLRVTEGSPEGIEDLEVVDEAKEDNLVGANHMTLGEISDNMGA